MHTLINNKIKECLRIYAEAEANRGLDYTEKKDIKDKIEKEIYNTLTGGFVLQNLILKTNNDNSIFWGVKHKEQMDIRGDWGFLKIELFNIIIRPIISLNQAQAEFILKVLENNSRNQAFRNPNYYLQILAQDTTKCLWSKNKTVNAKKIIIDFEDAHDIVYKLFQKTKEGIPAVDSELPSITKIYLEELRDFYAIKLIKPNLLRLLN